MQKKMKREGKGKIMERPEQQNEKKKNVYDIALDMETDNSLSLILRHICPGSTVLEFGPAMGRMTRYMKEELGCKVYIVEIDEDAFEHALQYAVDGVCCDVNTLAWKEKFSGVSFDAIIFADVLEHLVNPGNILRHAKELLKDDGMLFASVPNIGHSSILVGLMHNQFRYGDYGILDRTHLRFFTHETATALFADAGFHIIREEGVEGALTQMVSLHTIKRTEPMTKGAIESRPYAATLQFVFTMVKEEYYQQHPGMLPLQRNITEERNLNSILFINLGEGFSGKHMLMSDLHVRSDGLFHVTFDLGKYERIHQVRFDPCAEACKCRILEVHSNVGEHKVCMHNASREKKGLQIFYHDDPMYFFHPGEWEDVHTIEIIGRIYPLDGQDYTELMKTAEALRRYKIEKEAVPVEVPPPTFYRRVRGLAGRVKRRLQRKTLAVQAPALPEGVAAQPALDEASATELKKYKAYVNQILALPYTGEEGEDFVPYNPWAVEMLPDDIKYLAFYLPQFYDFEQNDAWWGKGFTEWTNVTKAMPLYVGQDQPRLAGELGYYELDHRETIAQQIELAKHYGIHGFCIYYYWFDGVELMEKPLHMIMEDPSLDIPFCLCWPNESWARTWDAQDHRLLIAQTYQPGFARQFMADISRYMRDPRYIRVDGKPVFIVYRAVNIPDIEQVIADWRDYCREEGIGEIYLMSIIFNETERTDFYKHLFDGFIEHTPARVMGYEYLVDPQSVEMVAPNFEGTLFDYGKLVSDRFYIADGEETRHKSVCLEWDNTARKKERATVFHNFSIKAYQGWLHDVTQYTKHNFAQEEQFVFLNAWNEWGEGTYLEPDRRRGYGILEATRQVLMYARDAHKENEEEAGQENE